MAIVLNRMEMENIHKRIAHVALPYYNKGNVWILVWGGFCTRDLPDYRTMQFCRYDKLWLYNTFTQIWYEKFTDSECPPCMSGTVGVISENFLYLFGGTVPSQLSQVNNLYRLDLSTLKWTNLEPTGPSPNKCDKGVGWAYDNKLYFFGGYGENSPMANPRHDFLIDNDSCGWNNQLFCYDPSTNSWSVPKVKGIPPPPMAGHDVDVVGNRAFIFGGRSGSIRTNNFYYIDMLQMKWSPNLNANKNKESLPPGRSWHSFTFVTPNKAILYGGLGSDGLEIVDIWECNLIDGSDVLWQKRNKLSSPLAWHKAVNAAPAGELIIVGGVRNAPFNSTEKDHVCKLTIIQYSPNSLERLCLKAVVKNKDIFKSSDHSRLPKWIKSWIEMLIKQESI